MINLKNIPSLTLIKKTMAIQKNYLFLAYTYHFID